ncbi:poly(glycerol-phosphate) alpha-glucosyltransferase [Spirosomataceae bacterium TFI 002]|nr:poly(glycerol-phosphate) alpha-glucosyltransferase [Spirosomataceae bacterium TFI 002]
MKVVQLPGSLSRDGGGVFQVALNHALQIQSSQDYSIEVIGKEDKHLKDDEHRWSGIPCTALQQSIPIIHQIAGLEKAILKSKPSIMHSHMLWTSQSRTILKVSNYLRIPYVVSPHGMLDPWTIDFKKRIALATFERKSLENAACIHALNLSEYETIRKLGFKNPIAIIPNGINLGQNQIFPTKNKAKKTLLFLSRIDPKKGLEPLIKAISLIKAQFEPIYELVIHGWGEKSYQEKIERQIVSLGLENCVFIKKAVFETEKDKVFQNCDAFILPSYSEGFPMVILEAWAHSKPVLMTTACNIPEGFIQKAAIKIETDPEVLSKELLSFISKSNEELEQIGIEGYELVKNNFTWPKIGQKLFQMYDWILKSSKKPDFIMLK